MRWRTRAPCPATTYLSWLSCEPKRCPLALENLPLRRLTPLEVVWRPGDPPAHYRLIGARGWHPQNLSSATTAMGLFFQGLRSLLRRETLYAASAGAAPTPDVRGAWPT